MFTFGHTKHEKEIYTKENNFMFKMLLTIMFIVYFETYFAEKVSQISLWLNESTCKID